jgi:aspartate/tyrosine/aromatic aminotransferase
VPAGDVVLLHAGCHNPTGVDPTTEQWSQIGHVLADRGAVPLLDFAYQGFADGIEADAVGVRTLCGMLDELIVCSSFSKNLGLYNERCGAMTVVARTAEAAAAVMSHVRTCIRANYSNPPAHGGAIATTVLGDADLRSRWEDEVATMRDRINGMRWLFARSLAERSVNLSADGNDFIVRQRGMFSFSGLKKDQVQALRDRYSIYIVGSGRINVAGMTEQNMPYLCDAVAEVSASG